MSKPTKEFVEIVKAGCNASSGQGVCEYPECALTFRTCLARERSAKANISVAFKQEPSEAVYFATCRSSGKTEGVCAAICLTQLGDAPAKGCQYAKELHGKKVQAILAQKLRDLGIGEER